MGRYFRLIFVLALCAMLLMSVGVAVSADDGFDTPVIEMPFDDAVDKAPEPAPDEGMPGWAIALIIVGSIIAIVIICFFVNWFFVLGRNFTDLKALFSKKPAKKKK